jgi:CubicO group peptidase (beta-lactamase class C family)
MRRRTFLQLLLAAAMPNRLLAVPDEKTMDDAADILAKAVAQGHVKAAVLHVTTPRATFVRAFGGAKSADAMFLLGSISKPICVTAMMTLFDQAKFGLDDPVTKYIPKFTGGGRDQVTLKHLLTHTSGLPDQLPENNTLRKNHASLDEFAAHAAAMPLSFAAGTRYQYSSMGILLATQVAQQLSGLPIHELVERAVFRPLKMEHSALGLGRFSLEQMIPVQTEHAAPEAGGGDPSAKQWDWNSPYWRKLGAPWGGVHASAPDLARLLDEFLFTRGAVVKPATEKLMTSNQNPPGVKPRGLGFDVGSAAASAGCSEKSFGHTGSTGTLFWADPATQATCVVLTSLPGAAVRPHPRDLVGRAVAASLAAKEP